MSDNDTERDPAFIALLDRARDCDPDAWREIHDRYALPILRTVRHHLPNVSRSEFDSTDLVQDVWLNFFRHVLPFQSFAHPRQLIRYLLGMARNLVLSRQRQCLDTQKRDKRREQSLNDPAVEESSRLTVTITPYELSASREEWEAALEKMPVGVQAMLRMLETGQSVSDVALWLDSTESAVLHVLRLQIRQSGLCR